MAKSPRERCLNIAYATLARQPRTAHQMREKLISKEFETALVEDILSKLISAHLIDDLDFSVQYIMTHHKRHGKYRMTQALKQKGVEMGTIEEAFENAFEESIASEAEVALSLLKQKVNQLCIDRDKWQNDYLYKQKNAAKLMRFLAGRGFSSEITRNTLKRVFDDEFFDEL